MSIYFTWFPFWWIRRNQYITLIGLFYKNVGIYLEGVWLWRNCRTVSITIINTSILHIYQWGYKTDSAFQRYILVTEDEMGGMKWLDQKNNSGTIDTYMDTNEHSINVQSL